MTERVADDLWAQLQADLRALEDVPPSSSDWEELDREKQILEDDVEDDEWLLELITEAQKEVNVEKEPVISPEGSLGQTVDDSLCNQNWYVDWTQLTPRDAKTDREDPTLDHLVHFHVNQGTSPENETEVGLISTDPTGKTTVLEADEEWSRSDPTRLLAEALQTDITESLDPQEKSAFQTNHPPEIIAVVQQLVESAEYLSQLASVLVNPTASCVESQSQHNESLVTDRIDQIEVVIPRLINAEDEAALEERLVSESLLEISKEYDEASKAALVALEEEMSELRSTVLRVPKTFEDSVDTQGAVAESVDHENSIAEKIRLTLEERSRKDEEERRKVAEENEKRFAILLENAHREVKAVKIQRNVRGYQHRRRVALIRVKHTEEERLRREKEERLLREEEERLRREEEERLLREEEERLLREEEERLRREEEERLRRDEEERIRREEEERIRREEEERRRREDEERLRREEEERLRREEEERLRREEEERIRREEEERLRREDEERLLREEEERLRREEEERIRREEDIRLMHTEDHRSFIYRDEQTKYMLRRMKELSGPVEIYFSTTDFDSEVSSDDEDSKGVPLPKSVMSEVPAPIPPSSIKPMTIPVSVRTGSWLSSTTQAAEIEKTIPPTSIDMQSVLPNVGSQVSTAPLSTGELHIITNRIAAECISSSDTLSSFVASTVKEVIQRSTNVTRPVLSAPIEVNLPCKKTQEESLILLGLRYWISSFGSEVSTSFLSLNGKLVDDGSPSSDPRKILEMNVEGISELDFLSQYSGLVKLSLNVNRISSLPTPILAGMSSTLRILNLSDNAISTLDSFPKLSCLQQLILDTNRLSKLEIHKDQFPSLRLFSANCNRITSIGEFHCPVLSRLNLYSNKLSESSDNCGLFGAKWYSPALVNLNLGRNQLTALNGIAISRLCPLMGTLILSQNALVTPPSPLYLPVLSALWLNGNAITDMAPWVSSNGNIPLFTPALRKLYLSDNRLSDIPDTLPNCWPLLRELDLSFNTIPSIASLRSISMFTQLTILKLNDNPVARARNTVATATAVDADAPQPLDEGITSATSRDYVRRFSITQQSSALNSNVGSQLEALYVAEEESLGLTKWATLFLPMLSVLNGEVITPSARTTLLQIRQERILRLRKSYADEQHSTLPWYALSPPIANGPQYRATLFGFHRTANEHYGFQAERSETVATIIQYFLNWRLISDVTTARINAQRRKITSSKTDSVDSRLELSLGRLEDAHVLHAVTFVTQLLQMGNISVSNITHVSFGLHLDTLTSHTTNTTSVSTPKSTVMVTHKVTETVSARSIHNAVIRIQTLWRGYFHRSRLAKRVEKIRYQDDELDELLAFDMDTGFFAELPDDADEDIISGLAHDDRFARADRALAELENQQQSSSEDDWENGETFVYGDHIRRRPSSVKQTTEAWSEARQDDLGVTLPCSISAPVSRQSVLGSRPSSSRSTGSSMTITSGRSFADDVSINSQMTNHGRTAEIQQEWGISDPRVLATLMKRNRRMKTFQKAKEEREREKDPAIRYQRFQRIAGKSGANRGTKRGGTGGVIPPAWMLGQDV